MLIGPRVILFGMFLGSDLLGKAYETNLWPFLGFLFLPWTTLAYTFAMNDRGGLEGPYLILFIGALILDVFATRKNSGQDSAVRLRVNRMVKRKSDPRSVDARVIDIDKKD
jgi:hypothetical protein